MSIMSCGKIRMGASWSFGATYWDFMSKHPPWLIAAVTVAMGCEHPAATRQPAEAVPASRAAASEARPRFPGERFREAFETSAARFEAEIAREPDNASAHAGLAATRSTLWCFGFWSRREAFPEARAAAMKAVQLDGALGAAHTALGIVKLCDWDWGPTGRRQSWRGSDMPTA